MKILISLVLVLAIAAAVFCCHSADFCQSNFGACNNGNGHGNGNGGGVTTLADIHEAAADEELVETYELDADATVLDRRDISNPPSRPPSTNNPPSRPPSTNNPPARPPSNPRTDNNAPTDESKPVPPPKPPTAEEIAALKVKLANGVVNSSTPNLPPGMCYSACDWFGSSTSKLPFCSNCVFPMIVYHVNASTTKKCYDLPADIVSGAAPLKLINDMKAQCESRGRCYCTADSIRDVNNVVLLHQEIGKAIKSMIQDVDATTAQLLMRFGSKCSQTLQTASFAAQKSVLDIGEKEKKNAMTVVPSINSSLGVTQYISNMKARLTSLLRPIIDKLVDEGERCYQSLKEVAKNLERRSTYGERGFDGGRTKDSVRYHDR